MNMTDYFNSNEEAIEALDEISANKDSLTQEYLKGIQKLDAMKFLLEYYLNTGEALDPHIFGIDEDGDDDG